ncbi:MAG: prolipoprotein diacylglyceryl transferase [Elusimicrobia bacterium]|nr:prolipoprotein diacylglyceryl transferase [Elusimicrobiota bacterium]
MIPLLISLGPLRLPTYGAMIGLGALVSFVFLHSRRGTMGFSKDEHFWMLVNIGLISGFVGGRLLYLALYVPFSSPDFWGRALTFGSGFTVLGSFIAATLGVFVLCRRLGLGFLRVMDHVSLVLPLWHFFGRLGCFGAGCCGGRPSDVPWAVVFTDPRSLVPPSLLGRPLHPAQLYEALPEPFIVGALYFLLFKPLERGRHPPGYVTAGLLMSYPVLRFANEFFRADTVPLAGLGLTAAQVVSIAMFCAGAALALAVRRTSRLLPNP